MAAWHSSCFCLYTSAVSCDSISTGANFRDVGLNVVIQKFSSGSALAAALAGGAIDIGIASVLPLINAHVRGIPLTAIFPNNIDLAGHPSVSGLIVLVNSPIRRPRDLEGKIVAVAGLHDNDWIGVRALVDADGGNSATIRFLELPHAAILAACETGRVDAGATIEPFLSQAQKSGKARMVGNLQAAVGPKIVETVYCALTGYVEKNGDVAKRFTQVVEQSNAWCNAHRSEMADSAVAFTGVERSQLVC